MIHSAVLRIKFVFLIICTIYSLFFDNAEVKVQEYNETLDIKSLGKLVSFVFLEFTETSRGKQRNSRQEKNIYYPWDLTLSVCNCIMFFL